MKLLNIFLFLFILTTSLLIPQRDKSESIISPVSVTVGGDFPLPGTYPAAVGERADQFLTRLFVQIKQAKLSSASKLPQELLMQEKTTPPESDDNIPLRGLVLKRRSGEVVKFDLNKFRMDGDYSNNPNLQHEDVIIFPFYNAATDYVQMAGAVLKPGKYQFVSGDTYSSVLTLAGGVNSAYPDVKTFELSRMSLDGRTIQRDTFRLTDNPALKKGDKITLLGGEDLRGSFTLHLMGEFREVKDLDIPRGKTSLAEIIKRANGFTANADMRRIKVIKPSAYLPEYLLGTYGIDIKKSTGANRFFLDMIANREKFMFYRLSNMTELDTGYFFLEQRLQSMIDISSYDITGMKEEDLKGIFAEDGDFVIVPKKEDCVYVMGQVKNSGKIPAVKGKDIEYYITAAGGYGEYAETEKIAVIKRDTKEWINPSKSKYTIEPGDYIFVQRNEPRSFYYYFGLTSSYLNVIGGIATLTLLVLQFTK